NQHGNGHAPRGVANRNALAVLFESMLPWVTYEEGGPDVNQPGDGEQDNQ
ncbi:transcription factor 25-like, partial [Trifolium medium]|nr:transcription factor 25-like [Trifolium medium]